MKKPTVLMILDGFGITKKAEGNAVLAAKKPNIDALLQTYPHTLLQASGLHVGLPDGQMGNSEVGHLNIGSGRIVYQDLTKITSAIENKSFFENQILSEGLSNVKNNQDSSLHILGLLSDGGVHSHIYHIKALLDAAKKSAIKKVFLHVFLDGRDVPPRSALTYITEIEEYMQKINLGKIATVSGRYYAMDRDNRWERIEKAYQAISTGNGIQAENAASAVTLAYESRNENDEFVTPTVVDATGVVMDGDTIIFANFRADRSREITRCFVDPNLTGFQREKIYSANRLKFICMTEYDADMPNVSVAFPHQSMHNTLGEYIAELGLRQLRMAETEKYAHVTFFFNGGFETPYRNEDRILIPSPKVATYDLKPEMSAYELTDKVLEMLDKNLYDLIIINYANPDMVGHTGVFDAAVSAVEAVDTCAGKVVEKIIEKEGSIIITADHGNADNMLEDGKIITAHSTNPVPFAVITPKGNGFSLEDDGILADIAPTILDLMDLEKPEEMTGHSLIKKP